MSPVDHAQSSRRRGTHLAVAGLAVAGLAAAALVVGVGGDGDDRTAPAPSATASAPATATPPSTATGPAPTAGGTPTAATPEGTGALPTGAGDPAAQQSLADRAAQEGALVSTTPATDGAPDVGALARSAGTGTAVELVVLEDGRWRTEAVLTAPEPLLPGRALEWRRVTGGAYPDAVVRLQGGSLHAGVDAAVATRDGGTWHWVPRQVTGEADGDPVLLGNPLFDDGPVFATRATAGGQVAAQHWRYDAAAGSFAPAAPPG